MATLLRRAMPATAWRACYAVLAAGATTVPGAGEPWDTLAWPNRVQETLHGGQTHALVVEDESDSRQLPRTPVSRDFDVDEGGQWRGRAARGVRTRL